MKDQGYAMNNFQMERLVIDILEHCYGKNGVSNDMLQQTLVVAKASLKGMGIPETVTQYVVQPEDTLTTIAARFYGSNKKWKWKDLAVSNTVKDPYLIFPGQILTIPEDTKVSADQGSTRINDASVCFSCGDLGTITDTEGNVWPCPRRLAKGHCALPVTSQLSEQKWR